jgi:hypothetical protein
MTQIRKYAGMILLVSFLALLTNACKEDGQTFPAFPAPVWSVDPAKYALQMTATVTLPSNLLPYVQADDQLAAFAGNKCRGTGQSIGQGLYRVTVYGLVDEQPAIHFQYYSAKNKYLYRTGDLFSFEPDKACGKADDPLLLPLNVVEVGAGEEAAAVETEEETFPAFPARTWNVDPAKYALQMTAVIKLPPALLPYIQDGDQLAAFAGNKCRGTGQSLGQGLYRVTVYALVGEQPAIHFRYYSAQNRYLYQTAGLFFFDSGQTFGTAEQPQVPLFAIATTDIEEEETFPAFSARTWNVNPAKYALQMTAVIQLPPALLPYIQDGDQLAVFAGNKCRGTGQSLGQGLYRVTVYGLTDEQPAIHFRYYSAQNRYLYQTTELFSFASGQTFGTGEQPQVPLFTIATTDPDEEEIFTEFSFPNWSVNPALYPVNMTAVLRLHPTLSPYAQAGDQVAAFAGEGENDCRGVGVPVGNGLYYITIHGTSDEDPNIHFRYYGAQYRYKYRTENLFVFETDKMFGVSDEPEIPLFSIVK